MNISFTIMAHGLEKAGKIEKALKDLGVPYEAKEAKSVSSGNNRKSFKRTTKSELAAVLNAIAKFPDETFSSISKRVNVHEQTVSKIARGVHPLQRNGVAT